MLSRFSILRHTPPEIVLGVSYDRIIPLAVEAIRALRAEKDAQIAALRDEKDAEIDSLRLQVAELRDLIHGIQREMNR